MQTKPIGGEIDDPLHPNTSPRRTWAGVGMLVAALGALPTLIGAALGAPLLLDDWAFAASAKYVRFPHAFVTEIRSRPVGGLWHWAEFRLFATHPVPHLLLLAALNALAAVLLWRLLERWLPRRIAVLASLVWVALPNRGSTHLWSTTSPNVFSLVMVLGALLVASARPLTVRRYGIALGMLVVANFTYEGAVALGAAGLIGLVWTGAERAARIRLTAITLAVLAAAAGWTLLMSPKLNNSATPLSNASHIISIHFGAGVLPAYPTVLATVVLAVTVWSVAAVALSRFKAGPEERLVLVGIGLVVLGAAPFAVSGFPFGTSGFFDRGNLYADVGTALVHGSMLSLLFRMRWQAAAVVVSAGALIAIGAPSVNEVRNYARAGEDGKRLLAAIDRLPVDQRTHGPITLMPLPSRDGVSEFLADYDISAALALRYHTGLPYPRAQMAISETGFVRPEGPVFELVGRRLVLRAAGD